MLKEKREEVIEKNNIDKVICLECGEEIHRKETYSKSAHRRKKFCNNSCAAKYNNRLREKAVYTCTHCGKEMDRNKKFCDNKCQADYEYKEYINRWKAGKEDGITGRFGVSRHIRRYLYEKHNNCCEKCGWNEVNPHSSRIPLEIEHKDGDYSNNKEENLELLCPNCHALTSTYKGANKGNGRLGRHLKTLEKIRKAEIKAKKYHTDKEEMISVV